MKNNNNYVSHTIQNKITIKTNTRKTSNIAKHSHYKKNRQYIQTDELDHDLKTALYTLFDST